MRKELIVILIILIGGYVIWSGSVARIEISDWIYILSTLLLGSVAIFGEYIKQKFFGPRLEIDFALEPPYCHRTLSRVYREDLIDK